MNQLMIIGLAYAIAIISLIAPGMLNMTAVSVALEKGKKQAYQFSTGASAAIFSQAFVAVFFSRYLANHPSIVDFLTQAAIVVFLVLAVVFFMKAKKANAIKTKTSQSNAYLFGFGLAMLNMLSVPFYLAISTALIAKGFALQETFNAFLFSVFAALGAFTVFASYAQSAKLLHEKARFVAQNINYILCGLFVVLSVMAWLK